MGMSCMGDSDTLLPRPRSLREPARAACNTFLGLWRTLLPRPQSLGSERGRRNTFLTKHSLGLCGVLKFLVWVCELNAGFVCAPTLYCDGG